ncbi:MAG: DNA translocase FtsK [Alkalispirochaeta sp.]
MSDTLDHVYSSSRRQELILATILGVAALVTALSILIAVLDPTGFFGFLLAGPGRVLYVTFHWAAWWIPLYLAILAVMSLRRAPVTWSGIILLNLVHLPVLTIAAILRLLVLEYSSPSPLLTLLTEAFTLRGAMLILSLLLAVESLVLMQVWRWLDLRSRRIDDHADGEGTTRNALQLPAPMEHVDRDERTIEDDEARLDEMDATVSVSGSDVVSVSPVSPTDGDEGSGATATEDQPRTGAQELRETLAALRRKLEEGLEDEPSDRLDQDDELQDDATRFGEEPLPLYFRRDYTAEADSDDNELDGYEIDDNEHDGHEIDDMFDDEFDDEEQDEVLGEWREDLNDDEPDDTHDEDPVVSMPISGASRERDAAQLRRTPRSAAVPKRYSLPIEGILRMYSDGRYWEIDDGTRDAGEVLRVTLEEFGIRAEVTGIRKGPVITMFEILPAPGVKLAKITNLADNIALRLAASSVRIVAPIPGKHAVGIEIPNKERNIVSFGELLRDDEFFGDRFGIPIALGKDIAGEAQIVDLTQTPHMLIAGATGSGKSVCVNSIICSILYRRNPAEVKLILIDPKIVELKFYNDIPHLLTPVITDPKRAFQALQYLIYEMERRYSLLDSLGARDISGYNAKIKRKNLATEPLPYIVVLIDEFADLMATSGKELESTVARLAAMSRAVGIHLVLATQRPSTDVITGLIKANIPSRIAFMVASKIDSRIIIDTGGAEKLLGRGDMLFTSAADPFPVRMQGAFLSEDEVEHVVEEVKKYGEPDYIDDEIFIEEDEDDAATDVLEDPLMERAIEVVTSSRKASASYLQRRLKVGYNRAARMVEEMERMGIVGPQNGSKPRDVISSGTEHFSA